VSFFSYGHYTTATGLLGVIGHQELWATNIKFLNDEHEFQHALDLIKRIIATPKGGIGRSLRRAFGDYLTQIRLTLDTLDSYKAESVFTLSFSEQTDLLSQWRGYCPDNSGYCIVFDAEMLHSKLRKIFDNCHLVRCIYNDSKKTKEINRVISENWIRYRGVNSKKSKAAVIHGLVREIVLLASYFKHCSFEEEQEHRLVFLLEYGPKSDIKFRAGDSSLVPYIEIPAPRALIKRVVIGPNVNKALAKRALDAYLEIIYETRRRSRRPTIEFAKTPYRP